jgi:DNA-binding beta-propeller fold protein YncE
MVGITRRKDSPSAMRKPIVVLSALIICLGCASTPERSAAPPAAIFYPALPQRPRLQFLHSISGESDLGKKQSAFQQFLFGKRHDELLGKPYDVGACKGKIYVLDRLYKKIVVLDLAGRRMSLLNDHGSGRLGDPAGIWVSSEDIKYVADMQRRQVVVFDANDRFLRTYGNGEIFEKPVDVAVHGNRVYVIDMKKEQLLILDGESGKALKSVGEKGEFFKPSHVTVGPSGDVFVTDAFHFQIKKFSPDGKLLGTIGYHGDQIGGFVRPKGAAVDKNGRLYVVDAAFENVQIFDQTGRLLLFFGGPGSGPGDLYLPAGIAVDTENTDYFEKFADPHFKLEYVVYVTNMFGSNMLNVYGFGHWIGESLPGE